MQIELSAPDITQAEIDAVEAVLRSGRLSLGPMVDQFEKAVAAYVGVRHAIAVSNGTCGLHLIVRALGLGAGDEVITTPFSFVASANCMLFERARPVFVDIDPLSWNIDPRKIEAALTPRTRALLAVNVFGQVADFDAIQPIARGRRLRVIEDSCESLGSTWRGRKSGGLADAGVFGFYPNKQITTGEGGMITTDDDDIARLCRSMRNQGRDNGMGWLSHERLGFNYRLSDINCALGAVQMKRIEEIIAARARVAGWYLDRLRDDPRLSFQELRPECRMSWFVFVVKLADSYDEQAQPRIIARLREQGIGCSNYFSPIHLQAYYRDEFGHRRGDFPVCERVAARTIALPFHNRLTEEQVDRVCATLKSLL